MGRNDKVSSATSTSIPLQNLPLNDDTWEAFVFAMFVDQNASAELNAAKFQQLCEWMSSGYRQKFSVVQRGDLITWALDNVKTFEPCKEIKALMDSGIPESELPDTSMARLVKLWMIVCKQEGVETKNAIKSQKETGDLAAGAAADSGGSGSAGAGGGDPSKGANGGAAGAAGAAGAKQGAKTDKDKDKERAKSSNVKKPAGPGGGSAGTGGPVPAAGAAGGAAGGKGGNVAPAKMPEPPRPESANTPADLSKRKNKLRDRTGKGDTKPVAIGDEPCDGPDVYYLLKDFDSMPNFLSVLMDETEVPISAVLRVEDGTVTAATTSASGKQKGATSAAAQPDASPAPAGSAAASHAGAASSQSGSGISATANAVWANLRSIASKASEHSMWRQTAWVSIPSTEVKDHKDFFDLIAKRIYSVLDKRKAYVAYYTNDISLHVPDVDAALVAPAAGSAPGIGSLGIGNAGSVRNDLRFYDFLGGVAASHGFIDQDLLLGLVLEHLSKASGSGGVGNASNASVPVGTSSGNAASAGNATSAGGDGSPDDDGEHGGGMAGGTGPLDAANFEDAGQLAIYFDKAVQRLAMNARELSELNGTDLPTTPSKHDGGVKLVQFNNETDLICSFMQPLTSLGLNPFDVANRISQTYTTNRFISFLKGIPELTSVDVAWLLREKMLQKTEFHRVWSARSSASTPGNGNAKPTGKEASISAKIVEPTMDQFLTQLEFERLLKEQCSPSPSAAQSGLPDGLKLQAWCWSETHDSNVLSQVLQKARLDRPEMTFRFSKGTGSLLLAFAGPGPIGALKHETKQTIQVRTKVGFSMFYDLLEQLPEYLSPSRPTSGDKTSVAASPAPSRAGQAGLSSGSPSSPALANAQPAATQAANGAPKYVYAGTDQIIQTQEHVTYMYPSNGVIIRSHKTTSKSFGKDAYNYVSWNNNVITFSSEGRSKTGAYFTIAFNNGAVFSCTRDGAKIHAQVSTADEQLVTYLDGGCVSQKCINRGPSAYSKKGDNELGRTIIPMGTVMRYLEDETVQVLYADGSLATYTKDRDIIKTTRDGQRSTDKGVPTAVEQLKVARERIIPSRRVVITREDMVTIAYEEDGVIVSQHADGTRFTTVAGVSTSIESPGRAKIDIEAGKDTVHLASGFKIERQRAMPASAPVGPASAASDAASFKITKYDMTAEVDASGRVVIELSSLGYEGSTSKRIMEIDWRKGTLRFQDMDGRVFTIDEAGAGDVDSSKVAPLVPARSFGGKLLRERLKTAAPTAFTSGNMPRLFVIHHDGTGEELLTDDDVQRYFQCYSRDFHQSNEEVAEDPASVAVTTITKVQPKGSKNPILVYRQIRRHPPLNDATRVQVEDEFQAFEARRASRVEPISPPNVQEDLRPLSTASSNGHASSAASKDRFTFGQNKVATEEAIVLKYWLREDLALRNQHQSKPTGEAAPAASDGRTWRKPRMLTLNNPITSTARENTKERIKAVAVRPQVRIDGVEVKYFDSPEGRAYLNSKAGLDKAQIPGHPSPTGRDSMPTSQRPSSAEPPQRLSVAQEPVHYTVDAKTGQQTVDVRPASAPKSLPDHANKGSTQTVADEPSQMAPAAEGNRPGSDKRPHSSKAVLQHHDSHAQPVDAVPRSPTKNGQKGTKQRPSEEARVPEGSPAKQAVPRKLNLPASIRAAKPGAEPNAKYLKQEAEARRKTMTASVSPMIKTIDSNYGLGSFVVLPGKCKFGTVKPGCVFETTLTMTNVGIDSTRYGVRQPKHPWLHVEYKPGPVAPGMNTKMVIKMTVPADATGGDGTQGPVQLADEFQIVSESEILHIPITAVLAGSTAKRG